MAKRALEEVDERCGSSKRRKYDRGLDRLSDELLLRTFSFLSVPALCRCQIVSRRFSAISGDSQIWKQLYYERFVRPRAARLRSHEPPSTASTAQLSTKLSKWLDESNLVSRGKETDWKRQYRVRDNWARGKCEVSEIDVAEQPPTPKMLVRLHDGVLFTVHHSGGLRVWSAKKERRLLAGIKLRGDSDAAPTSLAVDHAVNNADRATTTRLVVGFTDGSFAVYAFNRGTHKLEEVYTHARSTNGMISAVAYASPYLLTVTSSQRLSLYKYPSTAPDGSPHLLHSLTSQLVRPPLSLCVRKSGAHIVASIAYLLPTISQGWTVGIQELKLSSSGDLTDSRLATASGQVQQNHTMPLVRLPHLPAPDDGTDGHAGQTQRSIATSISYSHPYLLLSHSDNTLTLYLVTSTASRLSIGEGSRLWGHTSSVSGAYIGGRGKAVSVSSHGDELRVWELEGALSSLTMRKRLSAGQLSVRVQTAQPAAEDEEGLGVLSEAIAQRGTGLGLALRETQREADIMKGWVGFDEESAVVLKQRADGRQALVVYDFT